METLPLFDAPLAAPAWDHAHTQPSCTFCDTADPKGNGQLAAAGKAIAYMLKAQDWLMALPPGTVLSADDLVEAVGLPSGDLSMRGNNAVGACFTQLAKLGWLTRVGYVKSRRKSSHGTVIGQWVVNQLPTHDCAELGCDHA